MAGRKLWKQITGHWGAHSQLFRGAEASLKAVAAKPKATRSKCLRFSERTKLSIFWGQTIVTNTTYFWNWAKDRAKSWKQTHYTKRETYFNTNDSLTLAGKVLNKLQWCLLTHFREIQKTACHRLMKNVRRGYHSRIISLHWLMLGECAWVWQLLMHWMVPYHRLWPTW